ncbi:hypothetical protein O181_038163 [Austropuccinia psidii MF-1]|uniref:Uncharacterized protein n=1 Tax=Austropuccinia psidii MF-1 TaxID=1389203 RepID=A0A9Q3DCT7_9BASI|nr:hypothetical protein [Austropuccinia psidii MF-1]
MTIVHKAGNIHKNADGLSRWALADTPYYPAYVPLEAKPQIPIEGINITDVGTEFFEEVREYYKKDKNCHILTSLLDKNCKDTSLVNALDEAWKNSYSERQFHLFDGINYHRSKHQGKSCVNHWQLTSCPTAHAYTPTPPPDETLTLPPHLRPHHSLCFHTPASYPPWLTILMLLQGPQVMPPTPPSPPLTPPRTHLILLATNHPYPCGVPSQHASDATYHHCACIVPARHASEAAYHPYACSSLLTCLQRCLLSLRLQCPPNMPPTPT